MQAIRSIAGVLLVAGGLLAQPRPVSVFEPLEISVPAANSLTSAEINGDGYSDLAMTVQGGVEIILSNGKGGFHPPALIPAAGQLASVVAGDFNGDGIADLVVSSSTGVLFLPGLGGGAFGPPVMASTVAAGGLAAADFNLDGKLDVAVTAGSSVTMLLGNGDGTFTTGASVSFSFTPQNLFTADFNVDGKPDVLAIGPNSHGTHLAAVLLGNGQGGFTMKEQAGANFFGNPGLAIGDVNGDGIPDVLSPSGGVNVFLGNGDGTFRQGPYRQAFHLAAVGVGDVNGDGKADMVGVSATPFDSVSLMYGNGDGTFTTPIGYVGGPGILFPPPMMVTLQGPSGVQAFATLGSASPLSYYGDTVTILPVIHSKIYAPQLLAPENPFQIVTGDFNHDGKLDLATSVSTGLAVLLGNGDGTFQAPVVSTGFPGYAPLTVADMNADGIPDVVVTGAPSPFGLALFLGNGDGTFTPLGTTPVLTYESGWPGVADLNGDGIPDVVIIPYDTGKPGVVYLGNGDGTFGSAIPLNAIASGPMVFADFNRDGKMDMAVTFADGKSGAVMLGNGDGTFQPPVQVKGVNLPAAAGDLNGDGIPDLAGYSTNASNITSLAVAFGKGDGTFGPAKFYALQPEFGANATIRIADWNGDGHSDIAAMSEYYFTYFFLGDGKGNFTPQANGLLLYGAPFPAVGDFNGDGLPDVASADGAIWVLRNTSKRK